VSGKVEIILFDASGRELAGIEPVPGESGRWAGSDTCVAATGVVAKATLFDSDGKMLIDDISLKLNTPNLTSGCQVNLDLKFGGPLDQILRDGLNLPRQPVPVSGPVPPAQPVSESDAVFLEELDRIARL
jgi:hypothetical protein